MFPSEYGETLLNVGMIGSGLLRPLLSIVAKFGGAWKPEDCDSQGVGEFLKITLFEHAGESAITVKPNCDRNFSFLILGRKDDRFGFLGRRIEAEHPIQQKEKEESKGA